ncbi:hypothetical protein [Mesorhizobium sp. CN2-181]|uniref:hypothetical protein n=1 Tax=Mesorhizobium yinganensis TaxID=3157707 RepID=UPI0032B874F7
MPSSPSLKGVIVRPGAARSRLEALELAKARPCPSCGARIGPSQAGPADPGDGAVWDIRAPCFVCGTVVRYLFDAGPGWPETPEATGGRRDPDTFAIHYGPRGTQTGILTADDLSKLLDDARATLAERETELAANPDDAMLPRLVAEAAAAVLRPLAELEAQNKLERLPKDFDRLKRDAGARLAAIGLWSG